MVRADWLPLRAVPEQLGVPIVPLGMVHDQVYPSDVRLHRTIGAVDAGIEQTVRLAAQAQLVLR